MESMEWKKCQQKYGDVVIWGMIFMVMIVLLFYHVLPSWIKKGPAKPPSPRGCGMAYMHLDEHLYKKTGTSPTRWCPSSLAKLVHITPVSLWFMVDIYNYSNYSIHGVFVNQHSHHYGAPPALGIPDFHEMSSNANVFFSVQPEGIPFSSAFGCLDFFIYTYGKLYLCSQFVES